MKKKDNVDVTEVTENETIADNASSVELEKIADKTPTTVLSDEQSDSKMIVDSEGGIGEGAEGVSKAANADDESISGVEEEATPSKSSDDNAENGDSDNAEKKPILERVKSKFVNTFKNIKDKTIGFFKGIGDKFKAIKERYKRDGSKKFTTDCLKSTWGGTKKLSKRWFIDAFTGMAQGLFVTLIAGTIIKQIGIWVGANAVGDFLQSAGKIASVLMGAGIGAGIASYLKAPKLVIFSSMVAGMIGAFSDKFLDGEMLTVVLGAGLPGNPISAYICSLIATEIGILIAGRTKLDILLVPLVCIGITLLSVYVCIPFVWLVDKIGALIQIATQAQPVVMGIVIAVIVGVLLTMPTSSAAICVALKLGGIAGGAAVVGCACQMVGFAVQSYRENKFSGLISQGIGTSMLQIPNIMKKPIILLPPIIASAIAGPLATAVFKLQCDYSGSGMGTSGLVGIFSTITGSEGNVSTAMLVTGIILLFFVVPIIVCVGLSELLRKFGLIKYGDMMLDYNN